MSEFRLLPEIAAFSDVERAEMRELSKDPDVAATLARAMALFERPLPVLPAETDELRETLRALSFYMNAARIKRFCGATSPASSTKIEINIPNDPGNTRVIFDGSEYRVEYTER